MPNDATAEFNKKFQRFEKLLKEQAESNDHENFHEALLRLSNQNTYIKQNFNLIEDLYGLRNVFSHRERGKLVASVSPFALEKLEILIEELKDPPLVIGKFKTKVYQAALSDPIKGVIETMDEKTFTHVPIYDQSEFIGVFSYTSLFAWLNSQFINNQEEIIFNKRLMKDVDRRFLHSPNVNFEFIPEIQNIYEVPAKFREMVEKGKRFDCLFITKHGNKREKITGIITSWDMASII